MWVGSDFFSSQVVSEETAPAPGHVRALLQSSIAAEDMLARTEEVEGLAQAYLAQKIVPQACSNDARHVALCSIARLDFLVSWNFKHLTNVRREAGFNAVNGLQGYPLVRIVAPTFLVYGYEEKDI